MDIAGRKPDKQWLDSVIEMVGLSDRLGHRPTELSGGQQQRVAVARALASRPEIIFGDEPTGNLDSRSGAEVLGFLRNSVRELGQTVVMVTHDPVAAAYADRVIFLADGRIVDEMLRPTADGVLDRMKALRRQGPHQLTPARTAAAPPPRPPLAHSRTDRPHVPYRLAQCARAQGQAADDRARRDARRGLRLRHPGLHRHHRRRLPEQLRQGLRRGRRRRHAQDRRRQRRPAPRPRSSRRPPSSGAAKAPGVASATGGVSGFAGRRRPGRQADRQRLVQPRAPTTRGDRKDPRTPSRAATAPSGTGEIALDSADREARGLQGRRHCTGRHQRAGPDVHRSPASSPPRTARSRRAAAWSSSTRPTAQQLFRKQGYVTTRSTSRPRPAPARPALLARWTRPLPKGQAETTTGKQLADDQAEADLVQHELGMKSACWPSPVSRSSSASS